MLSDIMTGNYFVPAKQKVKTQPAFVTAIFHDRFMLSYIRLTTNT